VFNGEETLSETLRALKKAGYTNTLVVSDGSTDRSVQIAKEHGVRVIEKPNSGKVDSIHIGALYCKTEYMAILDDDTIVPPDFVVYEPPVGYRAITFNIRPKIREKLIEELQYIEYSTAMDVKEVLRGDHGVLCISGALGVFHTDDVIREIGTHTRFHPGEDLQRSLLLQGNVWYEHNPVIETIVPNTIKTLTRQRYISWNAGMIHCLPLMLKKTKESKGLAPKVPLLAECLTVWFDITSLIAIFFHPFYLIILYFWYLFRALFIQLYFKEHFSIKGMLVFYPFYSMYLKILRVASYIRFGLLFSFKRTFVKSFFPRENKASLERKVKDFMTRMLLLSMKKKIPLRFPRERHPLVDSFHIIDRQFHDSSLGKKRDEVRRLLND
jgi:cellulose synthase/poly-beta-1,6-N-acetylglucosamine synthase-like glycosyltransferase